MIQGNGMKHHNEDLAKVILRFQRDEETDHIVYSHMAAAERNLQNKAILTRIANEEKVHAGVWKQYSRREVKPNRLTVLWYTFLGYLLGYTFVIKLMENGEDDAVVRYAAVLDEIPEARSILEQEKAHEKELHEMLDEERLRYVGAMVLGLNDALVELTGTIAGLTLALGDNRLVALAGIITGISATLSMAASNYLAERADGKADAFKSSLYTGVAYLITVVCLVLPYLLYPADMYMEALFSMLAVVVLIIFFFNYYISVAKSLPFTRRFLEMACISLGVAVISFGIGLLAKQFLGVEV